MTYQHPTSVEPTTKTSENQGEPRRSPIDSKQTGLFGNFDVTYRRRHRAKTIRIPIITSGKPTVAKASSETSANVKLSYEAVDDELATLHGKRTKPEVTESRCNKTALRSQIVLNMKREERPTS